jgi:integrase
MNEQAIKKLESEALRFFKQARTVKETSRLKFAAQAGISYCEAKLVFPRETWRKMHDEWLLALVGKALDKVLSKARYRKQFSVTEILKLLAETGIGRSKFMRLAGKEWRKKWESLPSSPELVLTAIDQLVEERVTPRKFNNSLVLAKAGACPNLRGWFSEKVRDARRKLLESRADGLTAAVPDGGHMVEISGCWIDLEADVWDMRPAGMLVERGRVRKDLAEIAWSLMRDDVLCGEYTAGTLSQTFQYFVWADEMLGSEVADVTTATLDQIQRAWKAYEGTVTQKRGVRAALLRTFSALFERVKKDPGGNANEMLSIAAWVGVEVRVSAPKPCEEVLTEKEMDDVLAAAFEDISAGVEFTEGEIDLTAMTTNPQSKGGADPVVRWGTALMILTMLFTGIRRQSVLEMRVGDWAEVHKGLCALLWRHGKKREEKLGVLPTSLARLLELYVARTQTVRDLLKTDRVFLVSDNHDFWRATDGQYGIHYRLYLFVEQHGLKRGGKHIGLHCTMLRRTFTTRELYRGRSIWALCLQLGHARIQSTRRYGRFDRFEHPRQVQGALDRYGKKSLTLWRRPVMLVELPPEERAELLAHCRERDQEVGLCRGSRCLKLEQGGALPPCSLCEHLVTGIEFLPAWEAEKQVRERKMEALKSSAESEPLLQQEKLEYRQFMTNFSAVGGGSVVDA